MAEAFYSRASITTNDTLKIKEDSMNPLISISSCYHTIT
nr:MAG TPA: hypothetical protein [Caudoviricetes sp.]